MSSERKYSCVLEELYVCMVSYTYAGRYAYEGLVLSYFYYT